MLTWGFRDDLKNLKKRLTMLQAVLDDAGTRKSLNNYLEQLWVENVEVEIEDRYKDKGSLLEVRYMFFLCLSNPLGFRCRIAHQVKDVNSMSDKEAHDLGIRARDLAPAISDYQYKELGGGYPPSCWEGGRRSLFGEGAVPCRQHQHRRSFLCRHCWD
ncbi:hypothetical protein Dimus_006321 [Dionaea muscipula]